MKASSDALIALEKLVNYEIEEGRQRPSSSSPSDVLVVRYAKLLKQCGEGKALNVGKRLHSHLIATGIVHHRFMGNYLMEMYGKCGSMADASQVFSGIRAKNVFSWTLMIAANAENGYFEASLVIFRKMLLEGVQPNDVTFNTILSACAESGACTQGLEIHWLAKDEISMELRTTIVRMYGRCRRLDLAKSVFDESVHYVDDVYWNAMMAAYSQQGHPQEALGVYRNMNLEGIAVSDATLVCSIDACGALGDLNCGMHLHERAIRCGFERHELVVAALITMYGMCGRMKEASDVFHSCSSCCEEIWLAMTAACYGKGKSIEEEGIELMKKMSMEAVVDDDGNGMFRTYGMFLKLATARRDLAEGMRIHELMNEEGVMEVGLCNSLIRMYGSCGRVGNARSLFDEMERRNVATWTSILMAYNENGEGIEAIAIFEQMELEGVKQDERSLVCAINACAVAMSLSHGKPLHNRVVQLGLASHTDVGNALVDMYGRCGRVGECVLVFRGVECKDLVSWTRIMEVYSRHSRWEEVVEAYREMVMLGVSPDGSTVLAVVLACSHLGKVNEGQKYTVWMCRDYGVEVSAKCYNCMVDLFARCGLLSEALSLLSDMPFEPSPAAWTSLLSACKTQSDADKARVAAEWVFEFAPGRDVGYVLLSNVYMHG